MKKYMLVMIGILFVTLLAGCSGTEQTGPMEIAKEGGCNIYIPDDTLFKDFYVVYIFSDVDGDDVISGGVHIPGDDFPTDYVYKDGKEYFVHMLASCWNETDAKTYFGKLNIPTQTGE